MSYAFTDRVVETALLSETKNYFCSVVSRNHKEKLTQLNALSQRFFFFIIPQTHDAATVVE